MNHLILALSFSFCACLSVFAHEPAKAGSLDKEGNLILHVFHSVDDPPVELPVKLRDDYGFMLFNAGSEEKPKMRLIVASKKDGKIYEASTWEDAEKIIGNIPERSKIHLYDKCLCPTSYGLPEDTWEKVVALIAKRKVAYVVDEDRITCTCSQTEK